MNTSNIVGSAVIALALVVSATSATAGPTRKNTWNSDSSAMACVLASQEAYWAEARFRYFWSIGDLSWSDRALTEWASRSYTAHNICSR